MSLKWSNYKQIVDVGLSELGHFVAIKTDGSSRVIGLDSETVGLKSIWEFKEIVRQFAAIAELCWDLCYEPLARELQISKLGLPFMREVLIRNVERTLHAYTGLPGFRFVSSLICAVSLFSY